MTRKFLAAMVLVSSVLVGGSAANAEVNKTDCNSALEVRPALLDEMGFAGLDVGASSLARVLTLDGTVRSGENRAQAEKIARSVSGVTSVQNDLVLASSAVEATSSAVVAPGTEADVKDAQLATRARLQLVRKLGPEGYTIETRAVDGVLTLWFGSDFSVEQRAAATAHERLEGATVAFDRGYSRVRSDLSRAATTTTEYVTENPGKTLLLAASVGFVLGLLIRRRRLAA